MMAWGPSLTREALLDAAELLFSSRGYSAVGIREIADQAGANVASIKYHFGSKRELYLATVHRAMTSHAGDSAWNELDPPPANRAEAVRALARFIERFLRHLLESERSEACSRLLIREALQPSDAFESVVDEYIRPNGSKLRQAAAVLLAVDDPAVIARHADSVLGQILHYRVFRPFIERSSGRTLTQPDQLAATAEHLIRFTLRGFGCTPAEIESALDALRAPHATGSTSP